jgi:hypothetical protein
MTKMMTATEVAAACGHNYIDDYTTLRTDTTPDGETDLRICGFGNDAFFEVIDDLGDPIGDMFYEIPEMPLTNQDKLFDLATHSAFYKNDNGVFRIQNCCYEGKPEDQYMLILAENSGEEYQVKWHEIKPTDVFFKTVEVTVSSL